MKPFFVIHLAEVFSPIQIGSILISESMGKQPVKVTGFTPEGDYITDELDCQDPLGSAYYVIRKNKAVKQTDVMYVCTTDSNGSVVTIGRFDLERCPWVKHGDRFDADQLAAAYEPGVCMDTEYIRLDALDAKLQELNNRRRKGYRYTTHSFEYSAKCPHCKRF